MEKKHVKSEQSAPEFSVQEVKEDNNNLEEIQNPKDPTLKRGTNDTFKKFVSREWKAFKTEKQVEWADKVRVPVTLDFESIRQEWKYDPENQEHWRNQKKKSKDDYCRPLFYTILTGLAVSVLPNSLLVFDLKAAHEYYFGIYYTVDPNHQSFGDLDLLQSQNCRKVTSCSGLPGQALCMMTGAQPKVTAEVECLEDDPEWAMWTLIILFLPGVFWSLGIYRKFIQYLKKINRERWGGPFMTMFFFLPLGIVVMVTFPVQLVVVSIMNCINNQDHWALLTTRIGIADGYFNAHPMFILQLHIFLRVAHRKPSVFQILTCLGSFAMLIYAQIESALRVRGEHSIGQTVWWVLRWGPLLFFNSAFKLMALSLITAVLRYEASLLYGATTSIWIAHQILFNEQILPRRFYHLFIGSGLHAFSLPQIYQEVKLIKNFPAARRKVWATRLTSSQITSNFWFQNIFWFSINGLTMITLIVLTQFDSIAESQHEGTNISYRSNVSSLWENGHRNFRDEELFKTPRALIIISSTILGVGLISLLLLWFFMPKSQDTIDRSKLPRIPGFCHQSCRCPGCRASNYSNSLYSNYWHLYTPEESSEVSKARNTRKCIFLFSENLDRASAQFVHPILECLAFRC